jgi:putative serine protease PepD
MRGLSEFLSLIQATLSREGSHGVMPHVTRRTAGTLAALAAAVALGAGVGAGTFAALSDDTPEVQQVTVESSEPTSQTGATSFANVYESAYKSVVEITASSSESNSFGQEGRQQAQGSGFVYDDSGTVITNQHVVDGASSIEVTLADGSSSEARVVGTDASTDLALLKVDAPANKLEPLALGDSTELAVGDAVVAIGSPFGLTETVTSGIVSALDRRITSPNGYAITGAIQTDAAINHGNSGGPLLNLQGEVVGVNAQIESESGGNDGVGFAVPSSTVRSVVAQLLEDGQVEHAYLGVSLADTDNGAGVRVSEVRAGSPAAEAGLEAGDVVTAVDGNSVTNASELQAAIDTKRPGEEVSVTYTRGGESETVNVELGSRPDS